MSPAFPKKNSLLVMTFCQNSNRSENHEPDDSRFALSFQLSVISLKPFVLLIKGSNLM